MNNNPVRYNDPSGHCYTDSGAWIPGGGDGACSFRTSTIKTTPTLLPSVSSFDDLIKPSTPSYVSTNNASSSTIDNTYQSILFTNNFGTDQDEDYLNKPDPEASKVSLGTSPNDMCNESNLVWCFYQRGLLPTGTYYVTRDQIDEVMLAVFYDLDQRTILDWFDRRIYDTPFWDYGGEANSKICVDEVDNCYKGVEVNYFAQGMFSAKFEGYDTGIKIVEEWKKSQYNVEPSSGTIYWFREGYNYWIDHSNENQ